MPEVDARILRLEQGVVTVLLLAGFVFQIPWMIPVAAVLPALDAALGNHGPTPRLWRAAVAPRLKPPQTVERAAAARAQELCVFTALVVATLFLLGGAGTLAALLAIVVAGGSALAATGLFSLGAELDRRNRPRRRGGGRSPDV
ncbi:MAG: DUF4395 family protein [Acidimicrobiia bacterium]